MESLKNALAVLICAACPVHLSADVFIRGDANIDGAIDISDPASTLGCLFQGQVCKDCEDAADSNDDGTVDLSDAVFTLSFAFLGGPRPSEPYPLQGSDPTIDLIGCAEGLGPELLRLEVAPATLEIEPGEIRQLAVTGVYSDGSRADRTASSNGTTYASGDPAVVSVSAEGLASALAEGETALTAALSGISTQVPCTVRKPGGLPPIVISEIMYHPLGDDDLDEYIEIYNRGTRRIDLSGWRFTEGVNFTFPDGTFLDPGGYLVIAKDADRLKASHGITNVLGNYDLQLDNGGEMVRLKDAASRTVNEVRYDDGGAWPRWADGWGSSLELIDLHGENRTPAAWAASDEARKSQWTPFQITKTTSGASGEFHILLLVQGECLLDDLQLLAGGSNRLPNAGFENGFTGWKAEGTHRLTEVTSDDASSGSSSLRLIAAGRGDTTVNRIECDTTATVNGGQSVTIKGMAKWIRGSRFLLTRLHGNTAVYTHTLKVPDARGTPGAPNSTDAGNRGPDIEGTTHLPILPSSTQKVTVLARISDIDGVSGVKLRYKVNNGNLTETPMVDNGTSGDAVAGDGVYTATVPAKSSGSMVAFWIVATDGAGAAASYPPDAPVRTCLYRTGEPKPASQLDEYHIWMPPSTISLLQNGAKMSNELLDITFVLNDTEVFYNAEIRYRGSPFIRSCPPTDPVNGRYAYRIDFGWNRKMKGRGEINLDNLEIGRDPTLQRERIAYLLCQEMGLPYSGHEFVRLWINGSDHQVYADVEKTEQDYIDRNWPDDNGGFIHKVDDYFEFDDGCGFSNADAHLTDQGKDKEKYRWNFEKRSHDHYDDWNHMFDLVAKLNTAAQGAQYEASVESAIDVEEWVRNLAVRRIIGDWDSLGYSRGKNMQLYYPAIEKRWKMMQWDMDFLLGNGDGAYSGLFGGIDAAINRLLDYPKYKKMYLQAFSDLVYGPFQNDFLDPIMDENYDLLRLEYPSTSPPTSIKDFVRARRDFVLGQIPPPDLVITTNDGNDFSTSKTQVILAGKAPLDVVSFKLNGSSISPQRTGIADWSITRNLVLGWNDFLVQGFDGTGNLVGSDSIRILRVAPCVPVSVSPSEVHAVAGVAIVVSGSGFVPGSSPRVRLASASEEVGFSALYVYNNGASFGDGAEAIDNASALLDDPGRAADFTETTHLTVNLRTESGGEIFPPTDPFPIPWQPNTFAGRFTGFIQVSSPGVRTFGVNSDDGFRLTINGDTVAEWPQPRGPAVSMGDYVFPEAGSYFLVLDWYENFGGDIVELFQEDASGTRALINGGSELTVTLADVVTIPAATAVVENSSTIRATFDLTGAAPGAWNLVITPEQGSDCSLEAAVTISP